MADDGIKATFHGIPDYRAALLGIPRKLRKRALLNSLRKGARLVRDEARRGAPVLRNELKSPTRKPGTLRRAIAVRSSRIARQRGNVGVFVNVRPAKGAKVGANSPDDPFYWRWINWGFRSYQGLEFLEGGAKKLPQALDVIGDDLGKQINKLNRNPKDPL